MRSTIHAPDRMRRRAIFPFVPPERRGACAHAAVDRVTDARRAMEAETRGATASTVIRTLDLGRASRCSSSRSAARSRVRVLFGATG
ncbi:MAG: hypothetical protein MZW92_48810 [Comamonadaceae bacterium]|nr:hypothetical protein [Comamonadaceae bacterium]